ncbi:nucleotide kinase domain-containing protein [Akkermansia muciniphila]|uniref:nucleotide kinase domain-containing protein n=1 Tax=Akkermansia muciniphila TaxID=239935 RepID=UPI000FE152B0|nr:nucleotide kinase domain-containing protein [Akkermansia muciniphila]QAA39051.1 hypothetical protein C1I90_07245 [Akkermansia muciniphila]
MRIKNYDIIPNDEVLRYYFYFMQERMKIFWNRCYSSFPLTKDPILAKYKFTNVYRACDRVSQYLISHVIYSTDSVVNERDLLLQILVFKIFNKIETWEYLMHEYGPITVSNFNVAKISKLLTLRQQSYPIFSNAYMMTGTHKRYDHLTTKHEKWLTMVKEEFLDGNIVDKILYSNSLEDIYKLLHKCSFIGSFLAYQYAIDFNYSSIFNFDENSFVRAGIGAIRGIKKCFHSYGKNYEDAIFYVHENIDELRSKYGYSDFKPIPAHQPTLLDLQNCFCETDKYLRAKLPELKVGNVRIKQIYHPSPSPIVLTFPPKWGITEMNNVCTQPSLKESILF